MFLFRLLSMVLILWDPKGIRIRTHYLLLDIQAKKERIAIQIQSQKNI